MANSWAYRATKAGAGQAATFGMLIEDGFLCRTAFARRTDGRRQFIPHV